MGRKRTGTDNVTAIDVLLSADISKPAALDQPGQSPIPQDAPPNHKNNPSGKFSQDISSGDTMLLGDLTTGIVLLTISGEVNWMNPAAEDLLGVSLQRAAGQSLVEFLPGGENLLELTDRARLERQSFGRAIKIPTPQRDGGELELAVRVSILSGVAEDQLLVEMFNLTQRQQLDRENILLAQHGASRQMIRQLAHEIRNPLGGLRGAAQLLERELDEPSLREFTQVIIGEADRLAALMDSLLGPGTKPQARTVNVHLLLEHVATIIESEWPDLAIQRDYDPSLPDIFVDRDQLTQAFLNLLRNASQAVAGAGNVVIRTRCLSNQIINRSNVRLVALIEIEDNGPGVAEDIADTLFFPLVSGRDEGTGLGLSLAQDLVNRQQGLIEYESEPGRTVFTVNLPIVEPSIEG